MDYAMMQIGRLMQAAYQLAGPSPLHVAVAWMDGWLLVEGNACGFTRTVEAVTPRWELTMDPRYLVGLLLGRYHWNDAEVSSHVQYRRVPEVYEARMAAWLERWHV